MQDAKKDNPPTSGGNFLDWHNFLIPEYLKSNLRSWKYRHNVTIETITNTKLCFQPLRRGSTPEDFTKKVPI